MSFTVELSVMCLWFRFGCLHQSNGVYDPTAPLCTELTLHIICSFNYHAASASSAPLIVLRALLWPHCARSISSWHYSAGLETSTSSN